MVIETELNFETEISLVVSSDYKLTVLY